MENSSIEWTDHTFHPWIGCAKVNELCTRCYAETMMDKRYGRVAWGPNGTRHRTGADNWRKPLRWNREAHAAGRRPRVFCASLADVFEDWDELQPWRQDLFRLIDQTTQLNWLMLTKRPQNIGRMWAPANRRSATDAGNSLPLHHRPHVWLGTSIGNQATADEFVPQLVQWRDLAAILFLSVEPLLGPIPSLPLDHIQWVIVGGESGWGARPMEIEWVLDIQRQCADASVPFFFKQWGGVNKQRLGRELNGATWDAIPQPHHPANTTRD